jgi:predicted MFS family arabinose efflux permease
MAKVGKRAHYQLTFAVLALGVAAFALLQSLVIPVLTTVQHQLHTTQDAATWVLTAYLLSASVMTPILGRIGDMRARNGCSWPRWRRWRLGHSWRRSPPRSQS